MQMASTAKVWTLEELHSLPDDGNKYELIRGELFVTPAPRPAHEDLAAVLAEVLRRYVEAERLGLVHTPRSVVVIDGSEVEPDLMVRPLSERRSERWEDRPKPLLVVEIASDTTRRRDRMQKREWYMDVSIPEYWIVDGETRSVVVVKPGREAVSVSDVLEWKPVGVRQPLAIDLREYFERALGPKP